MTYIGLTADGKKIVKAVLKVNGGTTTTSIKFPELTLVASLTAIWASTATGIQTPEQSGATYNSNQVGLTLSTNAAGTTLEATAIGN